MFFWSFVALLGTVVAIPTDEFRKFTHDDEVALDDEKLLMPIIPSGYSSQRNEKKSQIDLSEIVGEDNEYYVKILDYMKKGVTMKGLTFNIYDNNFREATIAFFRLLKSLDKNNFHNAIKWARENLNTDMVDYVCHVVYYVISYDILNYKINFPPRFMSKPNYFINGETFQKALNLIINDGEITDEEALVNQISVKDNAFIINSNYSGWNLPSNGCDEQLNYFREDIGLNDYYYEVQLMYPFWMSNEEIEKMDPKYADRYYYIHKQLITRYHLEREHLGDDKDKNSIEKCASDYNPYLIYDNGLPFPVRSSRVKGWNEEQARIKSIDTAIKECISKRVIFMDNGSKISMTPCNYGELLTKLLRANLDGIKSANFVRSFFGYGSNRPPLNEYNPAPSILHHPETSLRDPIYWYLLESLLKYYKEFEKRLQPFDMSRYETEEFVISDAEIPKITTYFEYYQLSLNSGLERYLKKVPYKIAVRIKRLNHEEFTFKFTVDSNIDKYVYVRLFIGPGCEHATCWSQSSKFYELDTFVYLLKSGINEISWTPARWPSKFSYDDRYKVGNLTSKSFNVNQLNHFRFPKNLAIPRGLEEGLNFTLFVLFTRADDIIEKRIPFEYNSYYQRTLFDFLRDQPNAMEMGFPFHKKSFNHNEFAGNYKFYNISIYHKKKDVHKYGYFSSNLD